MKTAKKKAKVRKVYFALLDMVFFGDPNEPPHLSKRILAPKLCKMLNRQLAAKK